MKNIEFKKLYIQNFLSVGNEPLEIEFNNGLNVITGYNRDENDIKNGCGKCLDKKTKIKVRIPDELLKFFPTPFSK